MFIPEAETLGYFTPLDGTIEFYGRIKAILEKHFVVVDLGAGRGGWFLEDKSAYRKSVRTMRGHVARVIACDVDDAVLQNQSCDENLVMVGGRIPLADASADVIIADYVLEHIVDPAAFYAEIDRVLKPGGYFCARTPHKMNYVTLGARLIKNSRHDTVLRLVQPERKAIDTFPTAYKLNTLGDIKRYWRPERWDDYSYVYVREPRYYFGSRFAYRLLSFAHALLPQPVAGGLLVYMRKRSA